MKHESYRITEENPSPATTKAYEGAFSQGSGYVHIRGSLEEGLRAAPQNESYHRLPANVTIETPRHPRSKCGTYLPGVTGNHPLLREELVNLPNPLCLTPVFEGEAYDLDECATSGYARTLHMDTGEVERRFTWHTRRGAVLACRYRRIVHRARQNLIVQHMAFTMAQGAGTLVLRSGIDADVKTNGYNHFTAVEKQAEGGRVQAFVRTDTGDEVYMVAAVQSPGTAFVPKGPQVCGSIALAKGQTVEVLRTTVLACSRDAEAPGFAALHAQLDALPEANALFEENAAAWQALWDACAVEIEGDGGAQRAVNFSLYHLLRCAGEDDRVAVCAKGFSGEAYFGHFFWDSEMYLLPFYRHTLPEVAARLLGFRIRTLPGAVKNAAAYGYPGAKYAWESSVEGTEQCPNWQYADHEIHVTADVAHALHAHWRAGGGDAFLQRAAPVLVETARYWLARVYEAAPGEYHLNGVMGPDEYVCLCNNNAYTNHMVRHALHCTLEALEHLGPAAAEALNAGPAWQRRLRAVAHGLVANRRPGGLVMQCDGFEDLEEPRFEEFWPNRAKPYGQQVSQERNYRTKALKQADALMLPYLFPDDFTDEELALNLDYYLPYTTHDSSLSAVVHSILCARLHRMDEAYGLFTRALGIDLDFAAGGAAEGVHIANCGGVWQAVVYGFAGLQREAGGGPPRFAPRLPAHWQALRFFFTQGGRRYRAAITHQGADVEPC